MIKTDHKMSKKILINGKGGELEEDVLEFVFFHGRGCVATDREQCAMPARKLA